MSDLSVIHTSAGSIDYSALDGYVNATELASACGSTMQRYQENLKNQEFIKALGESLDLTKDELIRKGTGRRNPRPCMVHPQVAIDFARWSTPVIAVKLNEILFRYLNGSIFQKESEEVSAPGWLANKVS